MTVLRVLIPEMLPHPGVSCPWVLKDDGGRTVDEGVDTLDRLPHAPRVNVVAPAARVLLTRVELPRRSRGRLREILAFALEDRLSVEPESVHAALGPRAPDRKSHAAAVVDREWLTQWLAAVSTAGRAARSMQVETCLAPIEREAWTVVWRGADSFVRTGPASGMAIDAGTESQPPGALALAVSDARAAGSAPQRLIVCADSGSTPDLSAWSRALALPCEAAPSFEWMQAPDAPGLELLQGDFAPAGAMRELIPGFRPMLVLASLIVALHVVGTLAHWALLEREKSRLRTEMKTIFTTSFPAARVIVDPALQMRRQLGSLRRAAGQSQADDFMPLMAEVALGVRGAGGRARLKRVSYEQGRLRIDVELADRAEADALLRSLQQKRLAAVLEAVDPRGRSVDARFAISARPGT